MKNALTVSLCMGLFLSLAFAFPSITSTTEGGDDSPTPTDGGTEQNVTITDLNVSDEPTPPVGTGFFGLETISPIAWVAILALIGLGFFAATNKRIRGMFTGEE